MSAVRMIAWRFLWRGTTAGKFSPMTLFAWLAIGVGIGAMSSLLSVMYGFETALKDRVLKAYPHVMVKPKSGTVPVRNYEAWTKKLKTVPGVKRLMPYAESEMIVQSESRTLGAVIWGIDDKDMSAMKDGLIDGALPSLESGLPQVVLGVELAHRLGANVGQHLKIISPIDKSGPMGLVPQAKSFEVAGIYSSGHYEFDQQYLFLLLEDAQDLLRWGSAISGWHIWANSLEESDELPPRLAAILPDALEAQSWTVFNSALFQSLKLEQYAMFTILSFAIAIAVMNIVITLTMHVTHKKQNIGILRALGASKSQVRQIFIWQGAFMGAVGLALGAVLTFVVISYIRYFSGYQLPDIYYDRSLPVEIRPLSIVLIYAVAIVMIYLATLYPAYKAARLHPIDAIRE